MYVRKKSQPSRSPLRLGSLFDGIGGFPLAAVQNGIEPVWASEIEDFPIQVTRQRFPDMLHVGDITRLKGAELPPVDIVTGGSPCQDLSLAGKRAGLAGERSGLFMEQIRIIKEMRQADEKRKRKNGADDALPILPRFMVWENVPGAFSSAGGRDFRAVLEETCRIADSSLSVPGPPAGRWESAGAILGEGFSIAWRVLDAQYWGVPQRRKRIFLVADFGGHTAPKILFEQESLPGYPAEGRGTRQGAAHAAEGSAGTAGRIQGITAYAANQRDEVRDLHDVAAALAAQPGMKQQIFIARHPNENNRSLTAGFSAGAGASAGSIGFCEEVSPTLKGSAGGNCMPSILCLNDQGCGSPVETSRPRAEKHRPSRQARPGSIMETSEDVAGTLRSQMKGHPPLVLFENHGIDSRYTGTLSVAPTMSARYGTGGNNLPLVTQTPDSYCIAGNIIDRKTENGGNGFGCQTDVSYTLNTADRHAVFVRQRVDQFREGEIAGTQSARQHKDATDLVCQPANSTAKKPKANQLIRRLTPLECERLQGFPDGWTQTDNASDSARYKALGNSVAIPCVAYVLHGIILAVGKENQEGKENAV